MMTLMFRIADAGFRLFVAMWLLSPVILLAFIAGLIVAS